MSLLITSLCIRFSPNILSIYPTTAPSISALEMLVRLCRCNSGNCLKYSKYSVLKNSFMVLKQVLKKKKSNCFAYFVLTMLTSVSTSTECSADESLVVTDDTFFSLTGDGQSFSFCSSFSSLFLVTGTTCAGSRIGSLNRLSIRAILSCWF